MPTRANTFGSFSCRLAVGCLALCSLFTATPSRAAKVLATNAMSELIAETTNHLGTWVWDARTADKQTVRLWKSFDVPDRSPVSHAILRMTVDNGYHLYLDGRDIAWGSDWRTVTIYDVTRLLTPGQHILAVDGFNDRLAAGLIFGLEIQFADQTTMEIVSDDSWRIVPNHVSHWTQKTHAAPDWPKATVVGSISEPPWDHWPIGIAVERPLLPLVTHVWQRGWFQLSLATFCGLALLSCAWLVMQLTAQSKAQGCLQVERVRIARDIHDDLGARLTELLLLGEVSQSELPGDSATRRQLAEICEKARGLSHAMDEVVWAVNSRRDTLRDFVNYVCKYAQFFFRSTPIRCRLDIDDEISDLDFDLPVRRNLLLAVKEALNNAAKHSQASEVFLRIHRHDDRLKVAIEDNGHGFDPAVPTGERNGLVNMFQRMGEIGGTCSMQSGPGNGCRIEFTVPFNLANPPRWLKWLRRKQPSPASVELPAGARQSPAHNPAYSNSSS